MKLNKSELEILNKVGKRTITYYTEEKDGKEITKEGLLSCIEDLLSIVEKQEEELTEIKDYYYDDPGYIDIGITNRDFI